MPPRLFIEAAWVEADGRRVRLPRDRTHYLRTVLRLRTGAPLTLFDGSGREYAAVLRGLEGPEATADIVRDIVRVEGARGAARSRVVLAAGLTKGSKLDLVVQKATELGAAAIHPLLTRRAVPRPDEGGDARLARWRRIAMEAAEQCGWVDLPAVHPVEPFDAFLARPFPGALRLCFHEGAAHAATGVTPLREVLAEWRESGHGEESVVALIGPEGGFAAGEAEAARAAGFHWVGLGPRVLRAETAALAALAVLAYEIER